MTQQRQTGTATTVKVAQAKGRPMLNWVGKRPLREVRTYPAQLVERFGVEGETSECSAAVAVRITDMLGSEVLVVLPVTADA